MSDQQRGRPSGRPLTLDEIIALVGDQTLTNQVRAARKRGATNRGVLAIFREYAKTHDLLAPRARGRYLDTVRCDPDPERDIVAWEELLYERGGGASIERPDEKPDLAPLSPSSPRMHVKRRTEVVDGSGPDVAKPWRIRPLREGEEP